MPKIVKKTTAAKPAAKKTAAKASASAADNGEGKRAAQAAQDAILTQHIVKEFQDINGDSTAAELAEKYSVSPVKILILAGRYRVESGDVPAIEGKNETALVNLISKERNKHDEFSSWGWLAVRSGKSEAWIKGKLAEAGLYTPGETNVATVRSESKPKAAASEKTTAGKKTATKRTRGNA